MTENSSCCTPEGAGHTGGTDGRSGEVTTTYKVTGMTCGHCEGAVSSELGELAGVSSVQAVAATGLVTVTSKAPWTRRPCVRPSTRRGTSWWGRRPDSGAASLRGRRSARHGREDLRPAHHGCQGGAQKRSAAQGPGLRGPRADRFARRARVPERPRARLRGGRRLAAGKIHPALTTDTTPIPHGPDLQVGALDRIRPHMARDPDHTHGNVTIEGGRESNRAVQAPRRGLHCTSRADLGGSCPATRGRGDAPGEL